MVLVSPRQTQKQTFKVQVSMENILCFLLATLPQATPATGYCVCRAGLIWPLARNWEWGLFHVPPRPEIQVGIWAESSLGPHYPVAQAGEKVTKNIISTWGRVFTAPRHAAVSTIPAGSSYSFLKMHCLALVAKQLNTPLASTLEGHSQLSLLSHLTQSPGSKVWLIFSETAECRY